MSEVADPSRRIDLGAANTYRKRYTLITLALAMFLSYGNEMDRVFNLWLFLVPLILLPITIYFVYMLNEFYICASKRQWRAVLSIIAAPLIVIPLFMALARGGINPSYIRFLCGRAAYVAEVAHLPAVAGPKLKIWNWGHTGGVAVPNIFYYLVFDESDEIALPVARRSAGWRRAFADRYGHNESGGFGDFETAESYGGTTVSAISGHFYLIIRVFR